MKFTLSWLKTHLETTASPQEICDKLTAIGLEVEAFTDKATAFAPFKVAYVEKAEKHPDADKLQVCTVKTESGTIQVVCGAPNARTGMKAIFAPDGTYIPGIDVTLKKTKIRGVESNGMLVSEKEMQLSEEHKGIIEVDPKWEIGTPFADVFGLNDPLIEINLTPNRPDCAGVRGIARDLAAAGLGTLRPQKIDPIKGTFLSPIGVKITDDGCPLFLGRLIRTIKNGTSPQWLQEKLKSVGLRPISALVDITNLMTLDQCRPLHVFDADKIKGDIVVRTAKTGEIFDALNDKSYTTHGGEVAITDSSGLLGLGGIVGGVSTGCTDATVNVFLEAAYFTPIRIARTGRLHDIQSDARYRFERGIDPVFTQDGIEMATKLILDLCGSNQTQVSEIVKAGEIPDHKRIIPFDPALVAKRGGMSVETAQQMKILENLGFKVSGDKIEPPSWRPDIDGAADIVEEIIRITGFEKIEAASVRRTRAVSAPAETLQLMRTRTARAAMTLRGMEECVTWSFMPKKLAAAFGSNDNPALTLSNPISADLDQMRPSILPNLIDAARRNADRSHSDVALCEVGPVFHSSKADGQQMVATGIRAGFTHPRHWAAQPQRAVDAYDAKADVFAVLESLGAPSANAQITRDAPSYYHPGRSGALRLGKSVLAYFGEIHPAVLEEMKLDGRAVGFEVFLNALPAPKGKGTAKNLLKLSPFQPVVKDFAFIVKDSVAGEDILKAARAADKTLITEAAIFDVYKGKGVEDGHKSVAFTVTLQPLEATLTDAQIESVMQSVINAVAEKTGGKLRS